MPNPPLLESHVLDYCWVCLLTDIPLDEHHVVPRAYGGEHGPQISICGSHHTLVHNIGLALLKQLTLHSDTVIIELADRTNLQSLAIKGQHRVMYLARIIANSGVAVASDENKTKKYSGQFSAEQHRQLLEVQRILGISNKHDVIVACLKHMHKALIR